jgi:hypothetical protein
MLLFHDETLDCVAQATVTRTEPGDDMPEVVARLSSEALGYGLSVTDPCRADGLPT